MLTQKAGACIVRRKNTKIHLAPFEPISREQIEHCHFTKHRSYDHNDRDYQRNDAQATLFRTVLEHYPERIEHIGLAKEIRQH